MSSSRTNHQYHRNPQQQGYPQHGPTIQPYFFMPPVAIPKFHATMLADGWNKRVKTKTGNYIHIPEAMRLTTIFESVKDNEHTEEVGRWILSTIDKGNFDVGKTGSLDDFLNRFQHKFEVPSWRKCADTNPRPMLSINLQALGSLIEHQLIV